MEWLFVVVAAVAFWILVVEVGSRWVARMPYRHGPVEGMKHSAPKVTRCPQEGCPGYEVNGHCTRAHTHHDADGPFR